MRDFSKTLCHCGLVLGSYPPILSAPKAGLNSISVRASVYFGAMRTYEEWVKGYAIHDLAITLTNRIQDELTALRGHIHTRLGVHPKALDLCLGEGGKCAKALKSACWGAATGAFSVILGEVCKVCVQATSAYIFRGA